MCVTVQAKASHSLCEILHLGMDWSNFSYMTFPSNTDPTAVSIESVASLEVFQIGTLLNDMWQSSMPRFSYQSTYSRAKLDNLTLFWVSVLCRISQQ